MSFLYSFFGFLLSTIYNWVGNYGVALILLTLFARILMLPMSVRQQKSTAKMQRLQSKVRKIQQQYAGDQRKIQEETQALMVSVTSPSSYLTSSIPSLSAIFFAHFIDSISGLQLPHIFTPRRIFFLQ